MSSGALTPVDPLVQAMLDRVPVLKDRVVLDLVNGLEVTQDLIRVRGERQGLAARLVDSFTGRASKENLAIAQTQQNQQEATAECLWWLQERIDHTSLGLTIVAKRLTDTQKYLISTHREVGDLRQALEDLDHHVKKRLDSLEVRLGWGEAKDHIDVEVSAWKNWKNRRSPYAGLPPAVQLLLFLDGLYWSKFWGLYQTDIKLQGYIQDGATEAMERSLPDYPHDHLLPTPWWLQPLWGDTDDATQNREVVLTLCGQEPQHPLSAAIAASAADASWRIEQRPDVPRVLSPAGICKRLVRERRLYADMALSRAGVSV